MALLSNITSSGLSRFSVSSDGAISFNREGTSTTTGYTFPTTDGSANQILKTNGAGVLTFVTDDPGGNVTGSGTLNKVARWTATGDDLGDGPITFSNATATASSTFGASINGTIATFSGAVTGSGFRTNIGSAEYNLITRSSGSTGLYIQQAGAGHIVDFQYGSQSPNAGTSALFITGSGTSTFSGDVNISKKLSVGNGAAGTNSQLTIETPPVASGGTLGASVFGFTGTSEVTSGGAVTPTNQIQFKPAMPAGYGTDGYNSVLEQQSGGQRIFYFRTSGASNLSIDVEHNGTFGGIVYATGGNSTLWNLAYANQGNYLPLAGGTMVAASTIDSNNGQLINVGAMTFNDPGVNEGIKWNGGNLWQIYESPDAQTNAAGSLQFVQNTTRRFSIDTAGNLDIPTATIGGGNIIMQNSHVINRRFAFDTLVAGSATAYMILCENAPYSDVNGTITMDRTSGLRHACKIEVIISSGSGTNPVGGMKAIGVAGAGNPFYQLVTCDYDDGTGSSSHIAVQISNPDLYYETSGAYFTGRIVNSNNGVIVPVLPAAVSNVVVFESNCLHNFQGDVVFNQGNIGIGVNAPTYKLDVNGNVKSSTVTVYDGMGGSETGIGASSAGGYLRLYTGGTNRVTVQSTNETMVLFGAGATGSNYMSFKDNAGGGQGYIGYGSSGSDVYYMVQFKSADIAFYNGSAVRGTINTGGTLTISGDVIAYGSPSDKRLKENIKPIESALDKVIKLQGVTFDWKDKKEEIDQFGKAYKLQEWKNDIGFIAQDVQKVIPELVRENEDGMLSMRHQGIAPILLEAIKELKAEIDELKKCNCDCKK